MYLTRLRVKNFRSIREADIAFTPLTLVVGANAAGKSNFISVFRFLSDILNRGIETAVSLQGGIEWLVNASLPKGTPIEIEFTLDLADSQMLFIRSAIRNKFGENLVYTYQKLNYSLQIIPNKRGNGYRIGRDELTLLDDAEADSVGNVSEKFIRKKSGSVYYQHDFEITNLFFEQNDDLSEKAQKRVQEDKPFKYVIPLLEKSENRKEALFYFAPFMFSFPEKDAFIRVFDFDPRMMKRPSPVESVPELLEDGSNIANVLRNLLRNRKKQEELTALLNNFLPFVEKVGVESNSDKSFSYKIRESYSKKAFHESFLSDGTVSVLAILIALYFQEKANIVILEEPERNLHPRLLSKLLAAAEDVSSQKQVILTTHNPEFLKHANIEHVLLISRDSEGFTVFQSPKDSETVRAFLENDLGMDDLFLQDMLGA